MNMDIEALELLRYYLPHMNIVYTPRDIQDDVAIESIYTITTNMITDSSENILIRLSDFGNRCELTDNGMVAVGIFPVANLDHDDRLRYILKNSKLIYTGEKTTRNILPVKDVRSMAKEINSFAAGLLLLVNCLYNTGLYTLPHK